MRILKTTVFWLKIAFALYFVLCISAATAAFILSARCQADKQPQSVLGAKVYVMNTSTMGRTLPRYSIAVLEKKPFNELSLNDGSGKKGDVIVFTYEDGKRIAAHRVDSRHADLLGGAEPRLYYVTKGDLTEDADKVEIYEDDYFGTVRRVLRFPSFACSVVTNIYALIFTLILPAVSLFLMQSMGLGKIRVPELDGEGESAGYTAETLASETAENSDSENAENLDSHNAENLDSENARDSDSETTENPDSENAEKLDNN